MRLLPLHHTAAPHRCTTPLSHCKGRQWWLYTCRFNFPKLFVREIWLWLMEALAYVDEFVGCFVSVAFSWQQIYSFSLPHSYVAFCVIRLTYKFQIIDGVCRSVRDHAQNYPKTRFTFWCNSTTAKFPGPMKYPIIYVINTSLLNPRSLYGGKSFSNPFI